MGDEVMVLGSVGILYSVLWSEEARNRRSLLKVNKANLQNCMRMPENVRSTDHEAKTDQGLKCSATSGYEIEKKSQDKGKGA